MSKNEELRYADSMERIATKYDAFVIDQWGVIHDGKQIYPGVIETLESIKATSKPSIILTNSRKSTISNIQRLASMGVSRELYTSLISSGELLKALLVIRLSAPWNRLGEKAFLVANQDDHTLIQGTKYSSVQKIDDADFVLLLSTTEDIPDSAHEHWIDVVIKKTSQYSAQVQIPSQ